MDVSELNEQDLRALLTILQKDHPEALQSAIETYNSSPETEQEDITFTPLPEDETINVEEKFMHLTSKKGCYLWYDATSATLKLQYTDKPVPSAIGFYSSPSIPEFKYKKNFGRASLISGCAAGVAGRKQYYSGWCQFIRAARAAIIEGDGGEMWIFPKLASNQGLDVDIYIYNQMAKIQTMILPENKALLKDDLETADAVTCLPRHCSVFEDVTKMDINRWLVRANNVGATSRFTVAAAAGDSSSEKEQIDLAGNGTSGRSSPSNYGGVVEKKEDLSEIEKPPHEEEKGCYLLYDADACKLKLQYSKTRVRDAIGFYHAGEGQTIRGFKFTKNFGREELTSNCSGGVAGRKNFYSGWCQFVRAAKALNGPVYIYPRKENQPGLAVDIFVYYKDPNGQPQLNLDGNCSIKLEEGVPCNINNIDGIAVLPKHAEFFSEIKTMDMNRWMTEGNSIGATSRFE